MGTSKSQKNTLYLIYDHECPLCRNTAMALNIKKTIGKIELINARQTHPLVTTVFQRGLDPEQGIIVIYNGTYYHGAEAMHFLALLDTPIGVFNRLSGALLRSKTRVKFFYPILKLVRKLLLLSKGVGKIHCKKSVPIFSKIFGNDWKKISPIMKQRFNNRAYSNDCVQVKGLMTIRASRWMRFLNPLLEMSGALIAPEGEDIPVTVNFKSDSNSERYWFERTFNTEPMVLFKSFMLNHKENVMVEYMKFNVGWRAKICLVDDEVVMQHNGYVFRLFNCLIPIPLALLLGQCHVVETPISDTRFKMDMELTHFIFGKIYEYKGVFTLSDTAQ